MLKGVTIPMVPVLINTYYPPNQPTPARCYDLGRSLAAAVDSMPEDLRVAVVASGGLSHFVVNDVLDRQILQAMRTHDEDTLRSLPIAQLDSGTSEVRNWIAAAGAGRHLKHQWSTYIPAWRSPAGTGVGLAFGLWL
jgi:aromatic ring-opening dioxygenase catalytic subunit (LigB family)